MDQAVGGDPAAPARPAPRRRPRHRVSVVGVLGELLITAGVFVLLFLGWQIWLNDIIEGAAQDHQAQQLSQSWKSSAAPTAAPTTAPAATGSTATPVVAVAPGNAQKFGILYVPRFGSTWERPIAQGVGVTDVLDAIGVGHYPGTAMPGQVGNFAIAAHRHAYGGGFENLHMLHVGDHVYIGTKDGWYEYTFRDIQYVQADRGERAAARSDGARRGARRSHPHDDDVQPVLLDGRADDRLRDVHRLVSLRAGPSGRDRGDRCAGGIADVRSVVASASRPVVGAGDRSFWSPAGRDPDRVRVLGVPVDPADRVAASAGDGRAT